MPTPSDAVGRRCVHFQALQAAYHRDAAAFARLGRNEAAVRAQQDACLFHDLAWEYLAQLIGAE